MNRMLVHVAPLVAVACATAQSPGTVPQATETSRVARFVAGPGDRPQGALLRDGTLVMFSPGLSQRLPVSLPKNVRLKAVGERFSYSGNKTFQASTVTIAGISYSDDGPTSGEADRPISSGAPGGPSRVPPPPPPSPGVPPPPPGSGAPTPPPPPGTAPVPPQPLPPAARTPDAAPQLPAGAGPQTPPTQNAAPPASSTPEAPPAKPSSL